MNALRCALGFVLVALLGCGCSKSTEQQADDIIMKQGARKEHISELAQKGLPRIKKLLESKRSTTRLAAISALGELKGNEEATQILLGLTKGDDFNEPYFAVIALGRQGAPEAKEVIQTFFKSPNPRHRAAACAAIGEYGDKSLYPLLVKAKRDENLEVRSLASMLLGRLRKGS